MSDTDHQPEEELILFETQSPTEEWQAFHRARARKVLKEALIASCTALMDNNMLHPNQPPVETSIGFYHTRWDNQMETDNVVRVYFELESSHRLGRAEHPRGRPRP